MYFTGRAGDFAVNPLDGKIFALTPSVNRIDDISQSVLSVSQISSSSNVLNWKYVWDITNGGNLGFEITVVSAHVISKGIFLKPTFKAPYLAVSFIEKGSNTLKFAYIAIQQGAFQNSQQTSRNLSASLVQQWDNANACNTNVNYRRNSYCANKLFTAVNNTWTTCCDQEPLW